VYDHFTLGFKYLRYYLTASNNRGHGIHSPFVFEFITKVLNDKTKYPAYREAEGLRQELLKNQTIIQVNDLGAGSTVSKTGQRTIASIAKNAAKPEKFGQLLYRIVQYYQPKTILELGTSLGITTSYMAKANPHANVITLEGAKEILALAKKNFEYLQLQNIEICEGNFDNTLSPVISGLASVDLSFIDGNHRLEPTIRYFETILPKTHNFSIIILDDIHWSREMEQAWKYCKDHSTVTLSIDLFFIGILIFRKEIREKQHFTVRF
jgi:predicted O-methyltransferase YrrM